MNNCGLQNPLKSVIHQESWHSTLYSVRYRRRH